MHLLWALEHVSTMEIFSTHIYIYIYSIYIYHFVVYPLYVSVHMLRLVVSPIMIVIHLLTLQLVISHYLSLTLIIYTISPSFLYAMH